MGVAFLMSLLYRTTWRKENQPAYVRLPNIDFMTFPDAYYQPGSVSVHIHDAYKKIKSIHKRGRNLLLSEVPDSVRLKLAADTIHSQSLPLIHDLRRMHEVPRDWVQNITESSNRLLNDLRQAVRQLQGSSDECV